MKKFLTISMMCALAVPSLAFAQDEFAEAESEAAAEPAAPIEATPRAVEVEEEEEAASGVDGLSWGLFADAFYNLSTTMPEADGTGVVRANTGYMHADHHGFGLNFAGLDMSYMGEKAGATMSLRFGEGAYNLVGYDPIFGTNNALLPTLWQGFVTYAPNDKVTIDAGQFSTIYGAEVHESWQNVNYTRGAVYFLLQPFYHVGARVSYQVNDTNALTFIADNGGPGQRIDLNDVPGFGAQWGFTPNDDMGLYVGYYGNAPLENNNRDWNHFLDVVYTQAIGDVSLIVNVDANIFPIDALPDVSYNVGVSAAAGIPLTDEIGLGARGEYIHLDDGSGTGASGSDLVTGTLTLRYTPIEELVFSVDARVDWSEGLYNARSVTSANEDVVGTLTVGMTGHFGN